MDHVLDAMRVYAVNHPTVLHRSLGLVEQVAVVSADPEVLRTLEDHVQHLVESFAAASPHRRDLDALSMRADRLLADLQERLS